jgi:hypothetical protein
MRTRSKASAERSCRSRLTANFQVDGSSLLARYLSFCSISCSCRFRPPALPSPSENEREVEDDEGIDDKDDEDDEDNEA